MARSVAGVSHRSRWARRKQQLAHGALIMIAEQRAHSRPLQRDEGYLFPAGAGAVGATPLNMSTT
jgi:hypothetical protein